MKKILTIIGAVMCWIGAWAQTGSMVLTYMDGKTLEVSLSEAPVMTIEGEDLCITGTQSSYRCALADLMEYTFVDQTNGLNDIKGDYMIDRRGDTIYVSANDKMLNITLFTLQGTKIREAVAGNGAEVRVELSDLEPGVYVLVINGNAIKIIR